MKNRKVMLLLIPVLIGILFVLPLISADLVLNLPVIDGNYSGTMVVNVTTTIKAPVNVSVFYNSSGGAVNATTGTILTTITNDTANDVYFYDGAVSISGLSDLRTYNFTVVQYNITGSEEVRANATKYRVTIDNTNPTNGITLDTASISARDVVLITWAYADATSGILSSSTTITSPDNDTECPTITESGTSGNDALVDSETSCPGTYNVNALVTDYAGNTNNITKTFKVTSAGRTKVGGITGPIGAGIPVTTGNIFMDASGNIKSGVIIGIIAIVAIYVLLKKKRR